MKLWARTDHRSALSYAAVPFPPRLGQSLHLVRRLPLLFPSLLLPSRVLVGAAVLQAGQDRRVEHLLQVLLGQRGALHVGHSSDLHGTVLGICRVHRALPVLRQVDENLQERG